MTVQAYRFAGGIVHFNHLDAIFRDEAGRPVAMHMHQFCGPEFYDRDDNPLYPDEDDPLWEQFNGWFRQSKEKEKTVSAQKEIQRQYEEADAKRQKLLDRMNAIDAELGTLSPSDPKRVALKAEKSDVVQRYRGAKAHAKDLRRTLNSMPKISEADEEKFELTMVNDVDTNEMLGKLYAVLAEGMDVYEDDPSAAFDEDGRDVIRDFLDYWEHTHHDPDPDPVDRRS